LAAIASFVSLPLMLFSVDHMQTCQICLCIWCVWNTREICIISILHDASDRLTACSNCLQNDKELFMESLICRLDDDCDKLLICKLDLECKKMLHFHSEASAPRVSICSLHYRCIFLIQYVHHIYMHILVCWLYILFLSWLVSKKKLPGCH
jgi:hypothetical protein